MQKMTPQQRVDYLCVKTQEDALAWAKILTFTLFLDKKVNKQEYLHLLDSFVTGKSQRHIEDDVARNMKIIKNQNPPA